MDRPTGTTTFVFTDIEGSTQLWEQQPEAMKTALAAHDSLLLEAIESNHGQLIKSTGDGAHAAFTTGLDAIQAAIAAQRLLVKPLGDLLIKVRMGVHTGEAEQRGGDFYGSAVNRAARLMAAAHGGQILMSRTTAELVREQLPTGVTIRDLGEHRLKDLTRPEHIYQLTDGLLPADFPPIRSIDSLPNNLPVQLTSFVGRERELADAEARLDATRLLTLIGPGGSGKTRLALQLGAGLLSSFEDGVWLVELAPLADPSLVLETVASVFGLRELQGMALIDVVANYLRAKHLLLIFDNCEHLLETCANLADRLLRASQHVKIIATSREAFGIDGETIFRVPSLNLPDPDTASLEAVAACEAAQLFIERAAAVSPKFSISDNNAAAIGQICRRLDGIPLALELAAARVTVLSPGQIASRLDDRFKLLTGGSRTALPRQQTLRAMLDWSFDLLTDAERTLLRRLSVFANGWTLEAAESICGDLETLDLLAQLVNKSLVVVSDSGDAARYWLLETIRQYARDRLLEAGETEEVCQRHLDYFVQIAESAEPGLITVDARQWVSLLEAEYENLHVAIEWGMDNDLLSILRIAGALHHFWFSTGGETESRHWIEEALRRAEALPTPDGEATRRLQFGAIAKAWLSVAYIGFSQGDSPRVITACQRSGALAREYGDKRLLATALTMEASARIVMSPLDDVTALSEEALATARDSGDDLAVGMALSTLATRLMMTGRDLETAKAYHEQGLALLKHQDYFFYTIALYGLGTGARYQGQLDDARAHLMPLLPVLRDVGDTHRVNMVESELAHIERAEGNLEQAASMYRTTILEWQRLGHRAAVAHQLECLAFIAKAREQPERAARLFGAAEALRQEISIAMNQMEQKEYEVEVASLRAGMDESEFTTLWSAGRALTMEQAVAIAIEENDNV